MSLYSTLYASSSVPRNPMDLVFTRRNVDTGNTDFPVRIPSQSPPRNQWAPVPFPEYCLTSRPMIPFLARLLPLCLARRGHRPQYRSLSRHTASGGHHQALQALPPSSRTLRHHAEDPKHEPRCFHPRFPLRTQRQRARSIPSSASSDIAVVATTIRPVPPPSPPRTARK